MERMMSSRREDLVRKRDRRLVFARSSRVSRTERLLSISFIRLADGSSVSRSQSSVLKGASRSAKLVKKVA